MIFRRQREHKHTNASKLKKISNILRMSVPYPPGLPPPGSVVNSRSHLVSRWIILISNETRREWSRNFVLSQDETEFRSRLVSFETNHFGANKRFQQASRTKIEGSQRHKDDDVSQNARERRKNLKFHHFFNVSKGFGQIFQLITPLLQKFLAT